MRKNILFAVVLPVVTGTSAMAQNQMRLTQYMLQHSFINPAATGKETRLNAALFYRSQWTGMEGAPVTQGLAINVPFQDKKNNLGFTVYNEKIGIHKQVNLSGAYAYNINLSEKSKLAFGLAATLDFKQSNFATANPEDPTDPMFQANSKMYAMPNFKFGAYYFTEKYYAGFAIPNLLDNKIIYEDALKKQTSFNAKNLHYYFHGGYFFKLGEKTDLGFSTMIKQVSGSPMQIDLNPQLLIQKKYGVGFTYRTSKEISFMLNVEIKSMFRIGYAYDYALSALKQFNSGGHEIMLIYRLFKYERNDMPSF